MKSYDMILDLDSRLQQVVRTLPTTNYSANGRCKPVCKRSYLSFKQTQPEISTKPCRTFNRPDGRYLHAVEQGMSASCSAA